jgi:hypothetical protein
MQARILVHRTTALGACAALAMLTAAFDCSSLTTFSVDTDWQSFSVDSAALGLTVPSGSIIPAINCSAANDPCASASSQIKCSGQGYSCSTKCGAKGTCELSATAETATTIDLSSQIKGKTQASALSTVSLNRVVLNTDANTLNFDTPKVELYVGPNTASKSADAVLFATIPAIKKGELKNEEIPTTNAGKDAVSGYVKNYTVPFKMFAKPSLTFASGDPLPQGKLSIKVKAYFTIQPLK